MFSGPGNKPDLTRRWNQNTLKLNYFFEGDHHTGMRPTKEPRARSKSVSKSKDAALDKKELERQRVSKEDSDCLKEVSSQKNCLLWTV